MTYKHKTTNEEVTDSYFIMPDSWVNTRVVEKIRQRYSVEEEIKLNRLANVALKDSQPVPAEFDEYNLYVEQCRDWGNQMKALFAERSDNYEIVE